MNMPHKCGLRARVRLADGREGKVVSRSTFKNKTGGWKMEVLPDGVEDTGWSTDWDHPKYGHKASRVETYDDEVEILDIGSPTNGAIVHWAPYGQHIPLTCQICGANFSTKNIAEGRSLFHGWSSDNMPTSYEEDKKVRDCDAANHRYSDLMPNQELYELKYPPKVVQ